MKTKTATNLTAGDDPITAKAAEWLVAQDREMSASEQEKFGRWLQEDSRHAAVYSEMEETWSIMAGAPAPLLATVPGPKAARRNPGWMPLMAGVAAALVVGYVAWHQPWRTSFSGAANTEVGGLERMTLPDGSVVQLNTDSAVEVRYTASERRVTLLRGEAHFSVAKNPARPFLVFAGSVDVRAVGTAFDVRLRAGSVDVLVTEGKVRLERPPAAETGQPAPVDTGLPLGFLVAGEKASVPLARPAPGSNPLAVTVVPVPPDVMAQALAWREQQLQFSTETLAEMVAEFNRYNARPLVIADPRLATKRFGGTFPSNDSAGFVLLLEQEFGVVAERRADRTVLRLAP